MTSKPFASALCLILSPILVAQQVGQVENPSCGAMPTETFFAYRSSINLFGRSMNRSDSLSTIPFEMPVELTPVDPAAWANATIGSTLTLRVVYDVIVKRGASSYAYVYGGTLIDAKVIRVRKGKSLIRHGKAESRVKEVIVGKHIKLELESSLGGRSRFSSVAKNLAVWSVKGPFLVVALPVEYTLLLIFCSTGCDM